MLRTFLAFELDSAFLDEAFARATRLREGFGVRGRWVARDVMHVTARFFGETEEDCVSLLGEAMTALVRSRPPPLVRALRFDGFPRAERARVVVVDMDDVSGVLGAVAREAEELAIALGFAPEPRTWRAHLTLARCREPADLRHAIEVPFQPWEGRVNAVALFSSVTGREGPQYTELARADFPTDGPI